MKLLGTLGLLMVLMLFAAGFLVQAAMFLSFSIAGNDSKPKPPVWIRKGLVPMAALLLVGGIITSPILFFFDASWFAIALSPAISFGGCGILIFVAMLSLAE